MCILILMFCRFVIVKCVVFFRFCVRVVLFVVLEVLGIKSVIGIGVVVLIEGLFLNVIGL